MVSSEGAAYGDPHAWGGAHVYRSRSYVGLRVNRVQILRRSFVGLVLLVAASGGACTPYHDLADRMPLVRGQEDRPFAGGSGYEPEGLPERPGGLPGIMEIHADREMDWSRTARPHIAAGWLGIAMREAAGGDKAQGGVRSEGTVVEVAEVLSGSPAWKAGLQRGDLIHRVDSVSIREAEESPVIFLARAVRAKPPGSTISLDFLRNGSSLQTRVTLEERPKAEVSSARHPEFQGSDYGPSVLETSIESAMLGPRVYELLEVFREATSVADDPWRRSSPYRLPEVQYILQNPFYLPHAGRSIAESVDAVIRDERHPASGFMIRAGHFRGGSEEAHFFSEVDQEGRGFAALLEALIDEVVRAQVRYREIYSVLDASEEAQVVSWLTDLLMREEPVKEGDSEDRDAEYRRLLELTEKIDVSAWIRALRPVLRASEELAGLRPVPEVFDTSELPTSWRLVRTGAVTVIETPAGRLMIGDQGRSVFSEDADILIDLGGDDRYENCAAGASPRRPVSIVIDLGGNDTYRASGNFCQGASALGGGILLDVSGNDYYSARNHAQGAAVLGAGVLYDGAGDDLYECGYFCQGAAAFGIGGLVDRKGYDMYTASLEAQGFGFTGGFGGLIDGEGNDVYFAGGVEPDHREEGKAYQSFSQGFGLGLRREGGLPGASGGIGILLDRKGLDTYVGDYFGQGSAYWFGLGILMDREGDDRYLAGRYSQGAGIHFAAGLLMDDQGDDEYVTGYGVSQGCGHDVGIGVLWDEEGNDRYVSGTLAQGAGNAGGIGILVDLSGEDSLESTDQSDGYGVRDEVRGYSSLGVSIDLHSKDGRPVAGRGETDISWTEGYGIKVRER